MTREAVLAAVREIETGYFMESEKEGAAAAIRLLRVEIDRIPPGRDDWRTPPGAPRRKGCPVEEMPQGVILRVWWDGAEECVIGSADPGWLRARSGAYVKIADVEAWRPAAVGPGEVEG